MAMTTQRSFDSRWPGVRSEVNALVKSMVDRKVDPCGIGLALMMAGSEVLAAGSSPAAAVDAIEAMRKIVREQFPDLAEIHDLKQTPRGGFAH
jgi:hypothetical protein